jgi:peptide/nickel transport system ATP-binding protein
MNPLLEVRGLVKRYPIRRGPLRLARGTLTAVGGVDLDVGAGEAVALVGESGSGKTTLARAALRLLEPTAGQVRFAGEDLLALSAGELRRRRRRFQMIFQDASGSLDPRMRVGAAVAEPLAVHGLTPASRRRHRVAELLEQVGLPAAVGRRYPHELSGGQRQRVGIARALACEPELIVADEPVSALDASVRAQVLNLFVSLQQRLGLALLIVAHDLALVEEVADRVAVMYLGRVVEEAPTRRLFERPQHPYTVSLLAAVPVPDPAARRASPVAVGEPPSPLEPPAGCPFHPRCPIARPRCSREVPLLAEVAARHRVACHYPGEAEVPPIPAPGAAPEVTFPPA